MFTALVTPCLVTRIFLSIKDKCFSHTAQVTEGKGKDWENENPLQEKIKFESIKEPEGVQVIESSDGMGWKEL